MENPRRLTKIFNGFCILVFIIALLISAALLLFTAFSGGNSDSHTILGYRLTVMKNDSMGSVIPNGSLMFSKPYNDPSPNSIVLFKAADSDTLCVARLVCAAVIDGKSAYMIKPDSASEATLIPTDTPLENVTFASHKLGVLVSFFTSFYPFILCALLILLEISLAINSKRKSAKERAGENISAEAESSGEEATDAISENDPQTEKNAQTIKDIMSDEQIKTQTAKSRQTAGTKQAGGGNNKPTRPKKKIKEQSLLNALIEEKKKHSPDCLQTKEDTELSPEEARQLFDTDSLNIHEKNTDNDIHPDSTDNGEDIDALVDDILNNAE